jgi:hypothetical protein
MKLRSEAAAFLVPFTFGLIPIVGMISASHSVLLPEPISILRMVVVVAALLGAFYVAMRSQVGRTVAANTLGVAVLLVGLYPLAKTTVERVSALPETYVASAYLVLCVISALLSSRASLATQKAVFGVLGIIAGVFLVFSVALIGWIYLLRPPYGAATAEAIRRLSEPLTAPRLVARRPDVYHLVLDGMGRPDVLSERYGMRLEPSIEQFRSLGFQVDRSIGLANYVQTHLSIPSMLNVTYLDALMPLQRSTNEQEPLRTLVLRARVPHLFRQLGYHVEYIGGGSLAEGAFEEADVCDCPQLAFFESETGAVSLTPFKILLGLGFGHKAHFERSLAVFESFERLRSGPAPRYVFAHAMLPHPPFVVDERGIFRNPRRPLSGADASFYAGDAVEYVNSYRAQAAFTLQRALTAVERIIEGANREHREVIVIISGDHGPRLGLDAMKPTADSGRFTLPIWLAIRWPADLSSAPAPRSLVNVYRALFERVFGMNLPPLPNRGFVSGFTTPYDFVRSDADPLQH